MKSHMINKFLHWIAHLLKINTGKVVTYLEDDDIIVGFECDYCKVIDISSIERVSVSKIRGINNVLEES